MASNNSFVSRSSDVHRKKGNDAVDVSAIAETQTKAVIEIGATMRSRNEKVAIPPKPIDNPDRQPAAPINDTVTVIHAQALSSPCKQHNKTEEGEVRTADKPLLRTETSETGGFADKNLRMLLDDIMKPSAGEEMLLDNDSSLQEMGAQTQQQENIALSNGVQQVLSFPEAAIQLIPMTYPQQPIVTQPRYLRREEYLAAVMICTLANFTNPANQFVRDMYTHGKYEHLLGYATALDAAGQISTAQEVIILATAQCFRPLGLLREVDQSFELTANILKHCHSLARGELLRFLQTMLERAPAAFIPRGEAFIPILDGFAAVLESYSEVITLADQARVNTTDISSLNSSNAVLARWRVERENAAFTLGILQWLARQPAHWASLNGSKMLLLSLSDLVTDPRLDPVIHRMVVDYVALNNEFLPSVDIYIPQNVVLDIVISTFEHAAGRQISSLQYPDYMMSEMMAEVNDAESDSMLSATLTILYQYSERIPRESLVLPRFAELLMDMVVEGVGHDYRPMIIATMKRLFERFPDEFDVREALVKVLGDLLSDERCSDSARCMLRIIRERCENLEGKTG